MTFCIRNISCCWDLFMKPQKANSSKCLHWGRYVFLAMPTSTPCSHWGSQWRFKWRKEEKFFRSASREKVCLFIDIKVLLADEFDWFLLRIGKIPDSEVQTSFDNALLVHGGEQRRSLFKSLSSRWPTVFTSQAKYR